MTAEEAIESLEVLREARFKCPGPERLLQAATDVEAAIEAGMTRQLFESVYGPDRSARLCVEAGRDRMLDYFEVLLSVGIAKERLLLFELGFLTAPDGDLRKSTLKPLQELASALYDLQFWQERGRLGDLEAFGIRANDYEFFRAAADRARKRKQNNGLTFDELKGGRGALRNFLMEWWDTPKFFPTKKDADAPTNHVPPLCYFTDAGLLSYIKFITRVPVGDSEPRKLIRRTIDRLGLRRSRFADISHAGDANGLWRKALLAGSTMTLSRERDFRKRRSQSL